MIGEFAAKSGIIEKISPEGVQASIDLQGGYLNSLTAPDGTDILFPRQDLDGKDRGAVFFCMPFGPAVQQGMEQHGFARRLTWKHVDTPDDPNGIMLWLDNPRLQDPGLPEEYDGCSITLRYEPVAINNEDGTSAYGFTATATIMNKGDKPFITAPAFHPYLPVSEGKNALDGTFSVLGSRPSAQELDDTIFVPTEDGRASYSDGLHTWVVTGNDMSVYALWTNKPEAFVCVEPSMCGDAEQQQEPPVLQPNESVTVSMTLLRTDFATKT